MLLFDLQKILLLVGFFLVVDRIRFFVYTNQDISIILSKPNNLYNNPISCSYILGMSNLAYPFNPRLDYYQRKCKIKFNPIKKKHISLNQSTLYTTRRRTEEEEQAAFLPTPLIWGLRNDYCPLIFVSSLKKD